MLLRNSLFFSNMLSQFLKNLVALQEPEVPFVTVEYKNGRMVQAQADRNTTPPKEVMEFLTQWESWLKSSEKKKKAAKQVA